MSAEMSELQKKYFKMPTTSTVVIAWSDAVAFAEAYALGIREAGKPVAEPAPPAKESL